MALAKGGFEVPLKTFTLRLVFRRRQKKKPPPPVGFCFGDSNSEPPWRKMNFKFGVPLCRQLNQVQFKPRSLHQVMVSSLVSPAASKRGLTALSLSASCENRRKLYGIPDISRRGWTPPAAPR